MTASRTSADTSAGCACSVGSGGSEYPVRRSLLRTTHIGAIAPQAQRGALRSRSGLDAACRPPHNQRTDHHKLLNTQRYTTSLRSRWPSSTPGRRPGDPRRMHGVRVLRLLTIAIGLSLAGSVSTGGQAPAPAVTPAPARTAAPARPAAARPAAKPGHTFESLVKPFVMENCASCHG